MNLRRAILVCTLVASVSGCTFLPVPHGEPPTFSEPPTVHSKDEAEFPNWPMDPDAVERLIQQDRNWRAISGKSVGAGTTGARKIEIEFPAEDVTIEFKWKPMLPPRWQNYVPLMPGMLDGINNSPRKEIAAWKLQKLFLEPEDYVIPPSMAVCPTLDEIEAGAPDSQPTLEGTRCELGNLSVWMRNIEIPDEVIDLKRFDEDPLYAYYLSNLNLVTYLMKHHDGRKGNFVVPKDPSRPQVFAIDNGVSFGGAFYNWFVANWSDIRVPAFRKASIDRAREIRQDDLVAQLETVAEFELNDDGVFDLVVEPSPNLGEGDGVRYVDGRLQLGLTDEEIEDVWERLEDLIEDVDEGDIAVF